MSDQYLRRCTLILGDPAGGPGLDLSELKFRFNVEAGDFETPNAAFIRVYNLSDATARSALEFTRVILQAGYVSGNFGVIFDGYVKQFRRGRENPTDTYLDILASDGDLNYNQSTIAVSLAAGTTPADTLRALQAAFAQPTNGINVKYAPDALLKQANPSIRGKVMFGPTRLAMRKLAKSTGTTWSIQNGQILVLPFNGYLPGEAVVINALTGMIGLPEQTDQGITVRCLLNPRIQVGGLIHLNNGSIQPAAISLQTLAQNSIAALQGDGFYRVYVVEHRGGNRDNDFYTDITALAADVTAPAASAVA